MDSFNIHPNNFAIARAIDGDKSDNLEGVKGAGLKTISKKLSFLSEEKSYNLDELFNFCRKDDTGLKIFNNILQEKKKVELNYKLMQLYVPNISPKGSSHIKETVENFTPAVNRTNITKMMIQDGISEFNWESLFQKFSSIIAKSRD